MHLEVALILIIINRFSCQVKGYTDAPVGKLSLVTLWLRFSCQVKGYTDAPPLKILDFQGGGA